MARTGCKLQPGHLLTREERLHLRLAAIDLERQLDRADTPDRRGELQRLLANVEMERGNDKATRPRSRAGKRGRGKR